MAVKLSNYAKPAGRRANSDYYRWRVFLDEPEGKLREVKAVHYTLHPSFPEPNQVETDAGTKFALEASGWGEFDILATVRFKDGHEEIVQYRLNLSNPWPAEAA